LDARQGQLLAEDGGQLVHAQLDFQDVAARLVAGSPLAVGLRRAERLADVAVALAGAAVALVAEAELRNVDLRQRDADQVLALLSNHLAATDVLAQVALHLAADKPAEPLVIALYLLPHGMPLRDKVTR